MSEQSLQVSQPSFMSVHESVCVVTHAHRLVDLHASHVFSNLAHDDKMKAPLKGDYLKSTSLLVKQVFWTESLWLLTLRFSHLQGP